jgi:hypothetical protein
MTFPAGESILLKLEMSALLIIGFYLLEMVFGIFFITPMAINAIQFLLHSKLPRMRESGVLLRVAIRAAEALMI